VKEVSACKVFLVMEVFHDPAAKSLCTLLNGRPVRPRRLIECVGENLWPSWEWGHTVVQIVEALHFKLEGHGFDSRWCHWNFSLT